MNDLTQQLFSLREVYKPVGAPEYDSISYGSDHNCYAYALRLYNHGWATPGRLERVESSDIEAKNITVPKISKLIEQDGLERVLEHGAERDEHVIAAFVFAEKDFHFYSFDSDGGWSSKYASKPVSRVLGSIFDDVTPNNSDVFCGYYKVPESGITYFPRYKVMSALKDFQL